MFNLRAESFASASNQYKIHSTRKVLLISHLNKLFIRHKLRCPRFVNSTRGERKRHKSASLMRKDNSSARTARAFLVLVHFFVVFRQNNDVK